MTTIQTKTAKANPRLLMGVEISIPYLKQFKPSANMQFVIQIETINRPIGKLLMEPIKIVAYGRKMDDVL